MKNLLVILFVFILLESCQDYMNINSTLKELIIFSKKKYNLEYIGKGVAVPDRIKYFILSFKTDVHDVTEARKLLIDLSEDLILKIKSNPQITQFLEILPANENHLFLQIIFKNDCGEYGQLAGVDLAFGKVSFLELNPHGGLEDSFLESYSEAYFKVYGTSPPERY